MSEYVLDMSNAREKQLVLSKLRDLQGMHRITIIKHRARRSDAQNRLYWPAYIEPITDYLKAQGFAVTEGDVHEHLKGLYLRKSVVNTETGEVLGETVRSTTDLNVSEFSEYLDHIAVLAQEKWAMELPRARQLLNTAPRVAADSM